MKMIDFQEFIDLTMYKSIDTDGFPKDQPFQCVDLAKYYNDVYFNGFQVYCTKTGYAKDWATEKETNGLLNYYDETSIDNMIKGTLVVWGNCDVAPYSHIGFFVEDNGNGTFKCLQQNAPYPYVVISNIRYDGLIGAFIPKNVQRPVQNILEDKQDEQNDLPCLYQTNYNMYVRSGAGTNHSVKLVEQLTEDGQKNATSKNPKDYAIYKKGTIFTCYERFNNQDGSIWAITPSGYVCIKGASGTEYCSIIK